MNTESVDDIEARLRSQALRPADERFTRAVLEALPARRVSEVRRRSFLLATRVGIALAILVAAVKCAFSGTLATDTIVAIALGAVPVWAAIDRLCGPVIPPGLLRPPRLPGRHWR
jgi:hypothetical protein